MLQRNSASHSCANCLVNGFPSLRELCLLQLEVDAVWYSRAGVDALLTLPGTEFLKGTSRAGCPVRPWLISLPVQKAWNWDFRRRRSE
jgi:hypothetical protein